MVGPCCCKHPRPYNGGKHPLNRGFGSGSSMGVLYPCPKCSPPLLKCRVPPSVG